MSLWWSLSRSGQEAKSFPFSEKLNSEPPLYLKLLSLHSCPKTNMQQTLCSQIVCLQILKRQHTFSVGIADFLKYLDYVDRSWGNCPCDFKDMATCTCTPPWLSNRQPPLNEQSTSVREGHLASCNFKLQIGVRVGKKEMARIRFREDDPNVIFLSPPYWMYSIWTCLSGGQRSNLE